GPCFCGFLGSLQRHAALPHTLYCSPRLPGCIGPSWVIRCWMASMRRSISLRFISCVITELSDSVNKKMPSARKIFRKHRSPSRPFPALPPPSPPAGCNASGASPCSNRFPPAVPLAPQPQSPSAPSPQRETGPSPPLIACTKSPSRRDPNIRSSPGPSAGSRTPAGGQHRSEEHTSELQSLTNLVCRLLLE